MVKIGNFLWLNSYQLFSIYRLSNPQLLLDPLYVFILRLPINNRPIGQRITNPLRHKIIRFWIYKWHLAANGLVIPKLILLQRIIEHMLEVSLFHLFQFVSQLRRVHQLEGQLLFWTVWFYHVFTDVDLPVLQGLAGRVLLARPVTHVVRWEDLLHVGKPSVHILSNPHLLRQGAVGAAVPRQDAATLWRLLHLSSETLTRLCLVHDMHAIIIFETIFQLLEPLILQLGPI
jgi:hypothetical protein